ncbi:MAG: hypothetical protein RBS78_01535 [Coriobacteriia bacterium]|nr:hypothetical protein [Coriobacteriia bacterium]
MTPCVIIPTFWTTRRGRVSESLLAAYDHPTPVDSEGTLPACLRSLEALTGLGRVVITVAATDPSIEHVAEDRVRKILADFPGIDAFVFGPAELGSLHRRLEQLEFADLIPGVSLVGYGAVRNVGLIAAAVFGCETVLFIDDDQIINDPAYLDKAMEGVGEPYKGSSRRILAKTGYYTDGEGNYQRHEAPRLRDMFWRKADAFNEALSIVGRPPRITPSPVAFGGCLVLHRDMFCNVSFDPWVVRGEDIDYVINARMHGGDVFLDGDWSLIHRPPRLASPALQFRQDVYRFIYEHRKIEFAKSQVDLRQVTPESMAPYPGVFISSAVSWRAILTAFLHGFSRKEGGRYLRVARVAMKDAPEYAREHCQHYFDFQRRWPILMDRIWDDVALKPLFTGERTVDRGAITGRFPVVRGDEGP